MIVIIINTAIELASGQRGRPRKCRPGESRIHLGDTFLLSVGQARATICCLHSDLLFGCCCCYCCSLKGLPESNKSNNLDEILHARDHDERLFDCQVSLSWRDERASSDSRATKTKTKTKTERTNKLQSHRARFTGANSINLIGRLILNFVGCREATDELSQQSGTLILKILHLATTTGLT